MEMINLFLSICLLACFIYEPGLPGGHPFARTFECYGDGRMTYSDPHSQTVEQLDRCYHSSSALLGLRVGCVLGVREEKGGEGILYMSGFQTEKLMLEKHLVAGKCPAFTSGLV